MKINARFKKEAVGSDLYTREILEMGEKGGGGKQKKSPGAWQSRADVVPSVEICG